MKRSADEALVDGGDIDVESHHRTDLDEDNNMNKNKAASLLHRTVTSLTASTTDDDTDDCIVQSKQQCIENIAKTNTAKQITRLINARILQQDGTLLSGSLDVSNGLIVAIHKDGSLQNEDISSVIEVVDCKGRILSPGYIDIQLNGAYGIDFSNDCIGEEDLKTEDVLNVAHRLVETGVTSFCPTMVSSSPQTYRHIMSLMNTARKQQHQGGGANILGMHLEGPFFAQTKAGAHDKQHIVSPVNGMPSVEEVYGIDQENIDIVTLAPELPGAYKAIQSMTAANPHSIVVSCGHTEATYDDGIKAVSCGATLLTHLFNAMNSFHHRKPGLVGLLSSEVKLGNMNLNRPFYSLIVDGIHVHESAVCMAYKSHPNGCILVTDAMAAMGLGDGVHSLGNMKVSIKGDRATLADSDVLAGSVVSMDTCIKRFHKFTGCSIGEALLCATLHPAQVLKKQSIGKIEVGAKADMILLNDELDVLQTWVGGKQVYQKKTLN